MEFKNEAYEQSYLNGYNAARTSVAREVLIAFSDIIEEYTYENEANEKAFILADFDEFKEKVIKKMEVFGIVRENYEE